MQSKVGRRFVGRLEAGSDILAELTEVCRTHDVHMGEVRGIGYLDGARLSCLGPGEGTFLEDEEATPPAQVLSLLGNISHTGDGLSLHLQAVLLLPSQSEPRIRAGRLVGGKVVDVEFVIEAFDDFTLVRAGDGRGLAPWVQILTKAPATDDAAALRRTDFMPGRLSAAHGDDADPEYELQPLDTLVHPRLGNCTVIHVQGEDRASIRLENGRVVELHLGLLRLQRTGRAPDGRQTFAVHVRKRS